VKSVPLQLSSLVPRLSIPGFRRCHHNITSTEFRGDNATHTMLTICVHVSKMQDQDNLEDTQSYMHVEKLNGP